MSPHYIDKGRKSNQHQSWDRIDRLGPDIEIARASRRIAVESVVAGIGLRFSA